MKTPELTLPPTELATQVMSSVAPWVTLGITLVILAACVAGVVYFKRRQLAKLKRHRRGRRKHLVIWM